MSNGIFHSRLITVLSLIIITPAFAPSTFGQHEGHARPSKPAAKSKPKPTTRKRAPKPAPQQKLELQDHSHDQMNEKPAAVTPSPAPSPQPKTVDQRTDDPPVAQPNTEPTPPPRSEGHETHTDPATTPTPADRPATPHGTHAPDTSSSNSLMVMSGHNMGVRVGASQNNILPMGQIASGTSWQPASTRINMLHKAAGDWLLMFHYNAVFGVNAQGGPRGVTKLESANWFMPMAFRKVGPGTLELRGMFSFEPFTFPPGGSPLLFQTGETYQGRPIIDAQHPHDLFMELSASYTLPLGDRGTWFTYFGYPGEPALGPTAFMHRASASENPAAALSHHLQDSSHISFGVFTTGFTYRWFKLEASVFNGREPDEDRYDLEAHPWNSRSARLSFAPNSNWSMQISHGLLKNPEALEPGDVRRTTASVSYNKPLTRGNWSTSLIWGRNHENHGGETFNLNGYVAESTINFQDKNYFYTRLELVDKNALLRETDRAVLGITDHHPSFRIGAYTFGGARDIFTNENLRVAIGGDVTFYSKPAALNAVYGADPVSSRIFLRFRPGRMNMAHH